MKFSPVSKIVVATFLLLLASSTNATLFRGSNSNSNVPHQEDLSEVLKGFDSITTHGDDGRELQQLPTTLAQCVGAELPLALCSCVFIDGGEFDYCTKCGTALLLSEFNLANTARAPDWFTDDSILHLAQTGTYKGISGIAEYVNFVYSIFFVSYVLVREEPSIKFFPNPNFEDDNTCIISIVSERYVGLNTEFYNEDTCYKTTVGTSLYYQPTTPENSYLDVVKVDVWYPAKYVEAVFTSMNREAVAEWLCGVVEANCPDTWTLNNFDNNANKCSANYLALPDAEGDLNAIDGKSFGCKILHATFVPLNPNHCAHTSFKKQEDPNGLVKCQKTLGTPLEELFTPEMLDFFTSTGVSYGYDPELLFTKDC